MWSLGGMKVWCMRGVVIRGTLGRKTDHMIDYVITHVQCSPEEGCGTFPFGNKGLLTDGHYLAFNI